MATDVYSVPLDEVVHEMAKRKYGYVVIADEGKVVGVFTTIDATEALSQILVTQAMTAASRPSTGAAASPSA